MIMDRGEVLKKGTLKALLADDPDEKVLSAKNMECGRKTLDDLFTDMTGRRLNE